ncbi:MAG: molybdopterin converting factor subunit 1 [Gammaproteobacteria bacterium]|nr:molybdopterin converting factor subunit 1 [Gammaproteobacteria bacterium]
MKIKVKYFASMRDSMGRANDTVDLQDGCTVADVWRKVSANLLPDNTLVAVNMEYTDVATGLRDGDEVAFFPPVTGG